MSRRLMLALTLSGGWLLLVAAAPQDASPAAAPVATVPPPTAAPVIVLPTPAATRTPTPAPGASPSPVATASPAARAPAAPRAVATPRRPRAAASATPAPTSTPTPGATPSAIPTLRYTPSATPIAEPAPGQPLPWRGLIAALALAGLVVLGIIVWRLRRGGRGRAVSRAPLRLPAPVEQTPPPTEPSFWAPARPVTPPSAPPPPPPAARARLTVEIEPRRAGLNLLSATAELDVTVRNDGDARAEEVMVLAHLMSARADQDAELATLFAAPPRRAAVPPFVLEAGETRTVRAVATLPRDAIQPMNAGGREIFVPIVAVDVRYELAERERVQTAQAYALGVIRPNSEKLAPISLDGPPRMFDRISLRPQPPRVES